MSDNIFTVLTQNPIFKNVSEKSIRALLDSPGVHSVTCNKSTVAYSSEESTVKVAFIISGIAKVYIGKSEESTLLKTHKAGDVFGIANLYNESEPFPSKIVTDTSSEILFIEGDIFKQFIESDNTALKNYLAFQSEKIVYLNKKISAFTAGSAEKKLSVFLIDHMVDDTVVLPCPISQLANMLNMGRASLYRSLDLLEEENIIKRDGKAIRICNKDALFSMVK